MDVTISLAQLAHKSGKLREAPEVPDTSQAVPSSTVLHRLRYRARIRARAPVLAGISRFPFIVARKRKREADSAGADHDAGEVAGMPAAGSPGISCLKWWLATSRMPAIWSGARSV